MADQNNNRQRELVYCHQCADEWYKDQHGLQCPACHSEIVEIIEADSDPREDHGSDLEDHDDHDPFHPFHDHNPWAFHDHHHGEDAPDPEEGDISHVSYTTPSGGHVTRTTYSSGGMNAGFARTSGGTSGLDSFGGLFSAILGGMPPQQAGQGNSGGNTGTRQPGGQPAGQPRSPLQEGPPMFGNEPQTTARTTIRVGFGDSSGQIHMQPASLDDFNGIFSHLFGMAGPGRNAPGEVGGGARHPMAMLQQLFNPANAQHGDAVYTNEALDRIVSQLMEQHPTSTAPGPASEAAINALPKIQIAKEQLDSNGKAECSICMENVELGSDVTKLPCDHWFHEACISAWLHEHDTCPQCRRGITPKEGDGNTPRRTGEMPMHWQLPEGLRRTQSSENTVSAGSNSGQGGGVSGSGTASSPYEIPSSPSSGLGLSPSRSRNEGRGIAGGIQGWMGRLRGHSNGNDGTGNDESGSQH